MATYNRLDDRYLEDPVLRSLLYRDVCDKANSQDEDLASHDIMPDEEYRPDLAAQRIWEVAELRWVVRAIAGVDAEWDPLPVGKTIMAPPLAWIRDRIRHYADNGEVTGTVTMD